MGGPPPCSAEVLQNTTATPDIGLSVADACGAAHSRPQGMDGKSQAQRWQRVRLHASIGSGQTFVWQEATHTSAAWHPCKTSSLASQLPGARCNTGGSARKARIRVRSVQRQTNKQQKPSCLYETDSILQLVLHLATLSPGHPGEPDTPQSLCRMRVQI